MTPILGFLWSPRHGALAGALRPAGARKGDQEPRLQALLPEAPSEGFLRV